MAYYLIDDESCIKEHETLEDLSKLSKDKFNDTREYDALVRVMTHWGYYKHVDEKLHFAYQIKNNEHIKKDIEQLSEYHDKADYGKMFGDIYKCLKFDPTD